MLKSYRHKGVKQFAETGSKAGIQPDHANRLRRLLSALDAATCPANMNAPGYALHPLKGELEGHWAVRVSGNWRLTFAFEGEDAILVDYKDYHKELSMLFHPTHPGEVLKDYLGDMTVKEAAKRLGVTRPNLSRILNGRAGISALMSVRLAKAMPYTSPEFWLKMQLNYDLWKAQKNGLPRVRPFPVRLQKKLASA